MKKHLCHLDLHQRSLYVTIGQKDWVQKKLLDSTEKKLLDSHKKKLLDKLSSSNQPNQSQNQSIDQGNLITNTKCLLIEAKHLGLKRSRRNQFTKNSVLQIDQGKPDITPSVISVQTNLSGEIRVEQTHDRSGKPDKHENTQKTVPALYREIPTLNTDKELIRERIEEDIDFNIPGLPHSTVKQLQSASVRELIQKNREAPEPTCSSTILTTESII